MKWQLRHANPRGSINHDTAVSLNLHLLAAGPASPLLILPPPPLLLLLLLLEQVGAFALGGFGSAVGMKMPLFIRACHFVDNIPQDDPRVSAEKGLFAACYWLDL
jgi:hypothetical protein